MAVTLLVIALALAATGWLGSKGSAASQPAPFLSPGSVGDPTPNPKCGVAGSEPGTLEALKLSVGAPEPGRYTWNALTEGNAVQMVRPCSVYGNPPPPSVRYDCYDAAVNRIQGDLANETTFKNWVRTHPGLTWLIGNEPDLPDQDHMDVTTYARMYEYYYSTIKAADPTAKVAIGAVSHADVIGAQGIAHHTWITAALNKYQELYHTLMPIDVWNFHMYNQSNYDVQTVKEPITAFINFVRSRPENDTVRFPPTGQPIWLTEWGRLNGWSGTRGNGRPDDDVQDPQMAKLMRDWAIWMQESTPIARWFWYVTTMGDDNKNFEFDYTGWLLQESSSFTSGVAGANSTSSIVYGVASPDNPNHADWAQARFAGTPPGAKTPITVTVSSYNASQHAVTLSTPIPNFGPSAPYKLFKSNYPSPLRPNSLGRAYMYFCNPGAFPARAYLPLVYATNTDASAAAPPSNMANAASVQQESSPLGKAVGDALTTPGTFASPLPTPPAPADHLLIDDFEYENDPTAHGWHILEPQGELATIAYKSENHWLMTSVLRGGDRNFSYTYPGDPASETALNVRFPFFAFEFADYDGWSVSADVRGTDGLDYRLLYMPQFGPPMMQREDQRLVVQYNLGEGYLDNQWHRFGRNLATDLSAMAPGVELETVQRLTFDGVKFLDDVMLGPAPLPEDRIQRPVEIRLDGMRSGPEGAFTAPLAFTAVADNGAAGSGVAAIFLRVDGRAWLRDYGMTHVLVEEGLHVIEVYAVDNAGNLGDITSVRVQVEPPPDKEATR